MASQLLDREEYIEQAYFFRVYRQRIEENVSAQEVLTGIGEEILATTKLPLAIDFLRAELMQTGHVSGGMARLSHYFTPFQAFVMQKAEQEDSRFDARIALRVLGQEAEYRSGGATPQGLFVFQFECLARNRLGYDAGLKAVAADPVYSDDWQTWILRLSGLLGTTDFATLLYRRSEHRVEEHRRRIQDPAYTPSYPVLFGVQEGRIAKANIGKDPLYMFAALQRQLGYPQVPRPAPLKTAPQFDPAVETRFQRLEAKVQLLESEQKGGIDLSQFIARPPSFDSSMNDA
ncbi:MAG: hypothetical protein KF861_12570 [Planctomycetaceae bacterium]|nr:hypothetical protein [Planctomycetaceae bacterium]